VIRVLLADDQALVRAGFRFLIESEDGFEVVGEAANGAEAVDLAVANQPDVVLMDIRMPDVDGIEATRRIAADPRTGATRVLVLTTFDRDEYVFQALRAGASGFLLKDAQPTELLNAIRVIAAGEALLAPSVTRTVIAQFARKPEPSTTVNDAALVFLTDREREVLTLIGRGLSNGEIGETLIIGGATTKTHVSRILSKLGARDRAQLVVIAYEAGLVTPGVDGARSHQP
jgi:DNA-binding NarL/FixJ family response regulator